jgi:hypothetical protein
VVELFRFSFTRCFYFKAALILWVLLVLHCKLYDSLSWSSHVHVARSAAPATWPPLHFVVTILGQLHQVCTPLRCFVKCLCWILLCLYVNRTTRPMLWWHDTQVHGTHICPLAVRRIDASLFPAVATRNGKSPYDRVEMSAPAWPSLRNWHCLFRQTVVQIRSGIKCSFSAGSLGHRQCSWRSVCYCHWLPAFLVAV